MTIITKSRVSISFDYSKRKEKEEKKKKFDEDNVYEATISRETRDISNSV